MTIDRTDALTARWSTLLDRLAQGPDGWGPHDTDALCEQVRRLVEERDRLRAALRTIIGHAEDTTDRSTPEQYERSMGAIAQVYYDTCPEEA